MSHTEPSTDKVAGQRRLNRSEILLIIIAIPLSCVALRVGWELWTFLEESVKINALHTLSVEINRSPDLPPDVNLDGHIDESVPHSWREVYLPERGGTASLFQIVIPPDAIVRQQEKTQQPVRPNSDAVATALVGLALKWSDPGDLYVRDGKVLLVTRDGETAIDLRGERIVFRSGSQYTLPKTATDEEIIQLLTGAVAPPY